MTQSFPLVALVGIAGLVACSGKSETAVASAGSNAQSAGATSRGGVTAPSGGGALSGGGPATGGISSASGETTTPVGGTSSGGAPISTGGNATVGKASGGQSGGGQASGGSPTGGVGTGSMSSGGKATGGAIATGGSATTGGANATGGSVTTGGSKATGGVMATGGAKATGGAIATGGTAPIEGAASFHCVNWADRRDNYVNGLLELSGLSSATDTYATVQSKANAILTEFQTKLKANSIRIPINEPTVSSTWWNAYKAVIDTAVSKGMKVVVAYWAYQNGKPDDATAFKNMWQVVVAAYQSNNFVYFDIHNEPYGYASAWNDAAAQWLTDFPNVPRGRVIVAGTGYDDTVTPVGSDNRFAGCLLGLHIYGFWHTGWTTQKQWRDSMTAALGSYSNRTLVSEWGAAMTTGTDYSVNTDGDAYRSYVRAVSDIMHDNAMGSCYWPGLRNGDSYSMTTLNGSGSALTLTVTNTSGLDRVHWAWQL